MINFRQKPSYHQNILDDHAYSLATRGFSVFEDFLTESECEYLKVRLQKASLSFSRGDSEQAVSDSHHLHDLICRDIAFARQLEDLRLEQIVTPILGKCWILYAHTTSSLPPFSSNYGSRLHVDSPRLIAGYPTNVGLLWALDEFNDANGGTLMLPGSHHDSRKPSDAYFNANAVRINCPKGAMLVFNARVWHRAGENTTAYWRHSLTMNVCRPFMKQRMDWVRFVPKEIVEQLNEQARRIIGFDTRLPTSLDEFFVSDSERLYKPNQE